MYVSLVPSLLVLFTQAPFPFQTARGTHISIIAMQLEFVLILTGAQTSAFHTWNALEDFLSQLSLCNCE